MVGNLKRLLLCSLSGALYYSGAIAFCAWVRENLLGRKDVCVLGLHRVLSEAEWEGAHSLGGIVMRESTFATLLAFLGRHFTVISLEEFLEFLQSGKSSPKPACLLTFDDGWRDNFTTALPCLKQHAMPAVVFAATGLLGKRQTFWVERLRQAWQDAATQERLRAALPEAAEPPLHRISFEDVVERLKHRPRAERDSILAQALASPAPEAAGGGDAMLSWEEAAQLERAGIRIEAHTVNHPLLNYEDERTVKAELADSRQAIEEDLHKQVRAFAYPNGSWNQKVRDAVEAAGYACAFTTEPGWHAFGDDPFTIRRIMLHESKLLGLDGKVSAAVTALRLTGWV